MITEKAPGKLYIAGEYAVLEQDCPAILVALDQYVRVSIKPSSSDTGLIHSKQYSQDSIHWVRRGSKMVIDNRDNPFEYILSAISFTERYCLEQKVKMDVYDLFVNSEIPQMARSMVWVLQPRSRSRRSRQSCAFMVSRQART